MTFVQEGSLAKRWHERIKSRLKLRGAAARAFGCRPNCSFRCRRCRAAARPASCSLIEGLRRSGSGEQRLRQRVFGSNRI